MRNRSRTILWLATLVVIAGLGFFMFFPSEPRYRGKRLTQWLSDCQSKGFNFDPELKDATKALEDAGPRAIPALLKLIESDDSPTFDTIRRWLNDNLGWNSQVRAARDSREMGIVGFFALGVVAEPAIPALGKLTTHTNADIATSALHALWAIGSTNCVPIVAAALTNSDRRIRTTAIDWLRQMGGMAEPAIPGLIAGLDDGDPSVRRGSVLALGAVAQPSPTLLTMLAQRLKDGDATVRAATAVALGIPGITNETVITALQGARQDPVTNVQEMATFALHRLACQSRDGGIFRGPISERRMALVFTGHEFAEGADLILNELNSRNLRGSFFLTGAFLDKPEFAPFIKRLKQGNHLVGPHSDKHLLYCSWENRDKVLVTRREFWFDLLVNRQKLGSEFPELGRDRYFLPPYEHYNQQIADWSKAFGYTLINFTPGTRSHADYTGEADTNFVSSQAIFDSILKREREDPHGLNGFILLLHLGSGPRRADKFHTRFGELLDVLAAKGYQFVRVDELLEPL